MSTLLLPVRDNEKSGPKSVREWLRTWVVVEKLHNPFGYLLLSVVAVLLAVLVAKKGFLLGVLILGGLVGVPMVFACMFNFKIGITLIIILSFFILGIKRAIGDVPLGLAMDGLTAIMFFGLIIKQTREHDWSFAQNPITKAILVWIIYNMLEVANPWAASRLAWVYTVRGMAGFMVMYFIVLYALDTLRFATFLIKLWLVLAFLGALYGINQEYIGFQQFETNWIFATTERYALLFQLGKFRKFSFFSDPMIFGFVMAYTAILCFTLMSGPFRFSTKMWLGIGGVAMTMAMIFSGTRAAYVLLPAGFFFYAVITFKKQIIAAGVVLLVFGIIFINIPSGNVNVIRFQSAFKPGEDASYKTRKRNQERIKPFIYAHPMGGGLGSVGDWGERFSPGSFLSTFPPDSGYIRIAVEMGWIGLILYCWLLYTVLTVGVRNYFRIRDPTIKAYMLSLLTVIYTLAIANFPQEALGQIPTSLLFYIMIALMNKLKDFDNAQTAALCNQGY